MPTIVGILLFMSNIISGLVNKGILHRTLYMYVFKISKVSCFPKMTSLTEPKHEKMIINQLIFGPVLMISITVYKLRPKRTIRISSLLGRTLPQLLIKSKETDLAGVMPADVTICGTK